MKCKNNVFKKENINSKIGERLLFLGIIFSKEKSNEK